MRIKFGFVFFNLIVILSISFTQTFGLSDVANGFKAILTKKTAQLKQLKTEARKKFNAQVNIEHNNCAKWKVIDVMRRIFLINTVINY